MKTLASKYYGGSSMYDKPAMVLDILLIGKFGSRKINPLMKDFTTNMGVVADPAQLELLADVVASYYKDMWDKRYSALTVEYNALDPYHITSETESSEKSTGSKQSTDNTNTTSSSEGDSKTSYDVTDKETRELVDSSSGLVADNGSSTSTKETTIDHDEGGTDTTTTGYGTGLKDERTITGDKTKEIEGAIEVTDGTDNSEGKKNEVKTTITNNPLEEGKDDARGIEHTLEGDVTHNEHLDHTESINKAAVQPYAPVDGMKNTNQAEGQNDSNGSGDVTRSISMDRTVDYSTQENTVETEAHTKQDTTYDGYKETESFNEYTDTNTRTGEVTQTLSKDDNFDETQSSTVNDVSNNTQTHNTTQTHEGTDTNTKSGDVSNEMTATSSVNSNSTSVEGSEGTKDASESVTEHGNKWWTNTNQSLIQQELELRKNNFYDSILADIAKLLTMSVYAQEDL